MPQPTQQQMDPNESAASLAFATHLQDGMQMHHAQMNGQTENPQEQAQEGSQTQEKPQEGTETGKPTDTKPDDMKTEMTAFKKSVDDTIKTSIGEIKDMIKSALAEDDKTDAKEESTEATK